MWGGDPPHYSATQEVLDVVAVVLDLHRDTTGHPKSLSVYTMKDFPVVLKKSADTRLNGLEGTFSDINGSCC